MRQLYVWFRSERRLKGPLADPGEIPEKEFLIQQSEGSSRAVAGTLEEILRIIPREERFHLGTALRATASSRERP